MRDPHEGPTRDECMHAMFAHALGVSLNVLGPLAIWQFKGKQSPFVEQHAKEAFNFQILLAVILLVGWNFAPSAWFPLMLSAYVIVNAICCVPAMIAASRGLPFRYRLPVRLFE